MITQVEKTALALVNNPDAKKVIDLYHAMSTDQVDAMLKSGWSVVEVENGSFFVKDGSDTRPVIYVGGNAYALTVDEHRKRVAEAFEAARRQKNVEASSATTGAKTNTENMCMSVLDGQLCGGTLIKTGVCPRCALGKMGISALLTCDVCGSVTAIMGGQNNG